MRTVIVSLALALSLVGCTLSEAPSSSSSPCPDAGATSPDAGPDAAPPAVDAGADAELEAGPCALRVDSIAPETVGRLGGELVTLKGCGFTGVRDVEVNVYSVPFVVVDDTTITFRSIPPEEHVIADDLFPYSVAVDVIRVQPDQVQTSLTYR